MTFHDKEFTHSLFDTTGVLQAMPQSGGVVVTVDDDPSEEEAGGTEVAAAPDTKARGRNFMLTGDRDLARGWTARARDNIAAIRLATELESAGRAPSAEEQRRLLRFTGFGATDLAQNCFRRPGADDFQPGWEQIGAALEAAVIEAKTTPPCSVRRNTPITRRNGSSARFGGCHAARFQRRAGARARHGNRPFLRPSARDLRARCRLTGVEYDPVTARIARSDPSGGRGAVRGLHAQPSRRRLRSRHRQSAFRRAYRARRPGDESA